jgi:hypothetical protein
LNFHHVGFHYSFNDFFGHEVTAFSYLLKLEGKKGERVMIHKVCSSSSQQPAVVALQSE